MRLIFNEIYLFSTQEKAALKISFVDGINVITSSQIDGTDRGKSVIMRSLYHALGADALFDEKWDTKNKVYILKFTIDEKQFWIYRNADMFKFFDGHKHLLFSTTSRHELSKLLLPYTKFGVQLPNRNNQKLELTPPVFNYLPFFLDQDNYKGTKFLSFDKLGQYTNYKEFVLFYHFGAYDQSYFELVRKAEQFSDDESKNEKRKLLLAEMQNDVDAKIGSSAFAGNLDALKSEIYIYNNEYSSVLTALNKCKEKLLSFRNSQFEAEQSLKDLNVLTKHTEKEIRTLHEHRCPECNSVLDDVVSLQSKRYNITEDIILVKNRLQITLLELDKNIKAEEQTYSNLLKELNAYERKMKINTVQVNDILRHKGLCELRDSIIIERKQLYDTLLGIKQQLSKIRKELKRYNDKKKAISDMYYSLLIEARTKFGLNEINPDSFKSLTKNFTASGSNKPIATVVWYLTLIKLRKQFNASAIEFPVVFDSPNNAETDDIKRYNLLQYILNEFNNSGQLILSSIGFEADKFSCDKAINVIPLENEKYHLLREQTYTQYYNLLSELCDAK
jgi:hypothetical protein